MVVEFIVMVVEWGTGVIFYFDFVWSVIFRSCRPPLFQNENEEQYRTEETDVKKRKLILVKIIIKNSTRIGLNFQQQAEQNIE